MAPHDETVDTFETVTMAGQIDTVLWQLKYHANSGPK